MKQENWRFLVAGLNVVNPRAVDRHVLGGEGWRGCGWHRRIDQRDYKRESRNLTENFPKAALFALTSQMRRAAISIPQYAFPNTTRPLLGLPENGHLPGSPRSSVENGMQRMVTLRSSLIFASTSGSPDQCASAKPP